jgi:hypothetical protein
MCLINFVGSSRWALQISAASSRSSTGHMVVHREISPTGSAYVSTSLPIHLYVSLECCRRQISCNSAKRPPRLPHVICRLKERLKKELDIKRTRCPFSRLSPSFPLHLPALIFLLGYIFDSAKSIPSPKCAAIR